MTTALLLALSLTAFAEPIDVKQGEIAVASADGAEALTTYGLTTCLAVVVYDREAKIGGLGHFLSTVDDTIGGHTRALIQAVRDAGGRKLEAQIYGGWAVQPDSQDGLINSASPRALGWVLEALKGIPIVRRETLAMPFDVDQPFPPARNIRLDLATGQVTDLQLRLVVPEPR